MMILGSGSMDRPETINAPSIIQTNTIYFDDNQPLVINDNHVILPANTNSAVTLRIWMLAAVELDASFTLNVEYHKL
jgi:hypothetical protein